MTVLKQPLIDHNFFLIGHKILQKKERNRKRKRERKKKEGEKEGRKEGRNR